MSTKRPHTNDKTEQKTKKPKNFNFLAHPRRKIALQFFYLGWEHDGLVQQPNTQNSVEHHLMEALLKTHLIDDWSKCEISRCGRTDKGVSAFRQTVALTVRSACGDQEGVFWDKNTSESQKKEFKSKEEELPYIKMLNGVLPTSIRVFGWAPVSSDFSARFDCISRTYKYAFPKANMNLEKMRDGASRLIGEHDFSNFCQIDMNEKRLSQNYTRRIVDVTVEEVTTSPEDIYSLVELTVTGSGFLWHQIRYIVTVLNEIGRGNEEPELVSQMLDLKRFASRPQYTIASDTPLCLFDCGYNEEAGVKWLTDENVVRSTISKVQKTWATYQTRSRMLSNMLGELTSMLPAGSDVTKGLHEFVQDRPIAPNYIKFADREKCETIAAKKEKLAAQKAAKLKEI